MTLTRRALLARQESGLAPATMSALSIAQLLRSNEEELKGMVFRADDDGHDDGEAWPQEAFHSAFTPINDIALPVTEHGGFTPGMTMAQRTDAPARSISSAVTVRNTGPTSDEPLDTSTVRAATLARSLIRNYSLFPPVNAFPSHRGKAARNYDILGLERVTPVKIEKSIRSTQHESRNLIDNDKDLDELKPQEDEAAQQVVLTYHPVTT